MLESLPYTVSSHRNFEPLTVCIVDQNESLTLSQLSYDTVDILRHILIHKPMNARTKPTCFSACTMHTMRERLPFLSWQQYAPRSDALEQRGQNHLKRNSNRISDDNRQYAHIAVYDVAKYVVINLKCKMRVNCILMLGCHLCTKKDLRDRGNRCWASDNCV